MFKDSMACPLKMSNKEYLIYCIFERFLLIVGIKAVNIDEFFIQAACQMLDKLSFSLVLMKNEKHKCFSVSSVEAVQDIV